MISIHLLCWSSLSKHSPPPLGSWSMWWNNSTIIQEKYKSSVFTSFLECLSWKVQLIGRVLSTFTFINYSLFLASTHTHATVCCHFQQQFVCQLTFSTKLFWEFYTGGVRYKLARLFLHISIIVYNFIRTDNGKSMVWQLWLYFHNVMEYTFINGRFRKSYCGTW